jgi:hypothetical protein
VVGGGWVGGTHGLGLQRGLKQQPGVGGGWGAVCVREGGCMACIFRKLDNGKVGSCA